MQPSKQLVQPQPGQKPGTVIVQQPVPAEPKKSSTRANGRINRKVLRVYQLMDEFQEVIQNDPLQDYLGLRKTVERVYQIDANTVKSIQLLMFARFAELVPDRYLDFLGN